MLDTAYIGSSSPIGASATASVFLSGATNVAQLSIGRSAGGTGTLNLNGQTLNVSGTTELGFASTATGIVLHNGGTLNTGSMRVRNLSSFAYAVADVSNNLTVDFGGTVTTANSGNVTQAVLVNIQDSTLNLGANLHLVEDLDIRGTGANVATVNANSFSIYARDIYVGRFGNHGEIINRGTITATRHLESSGGAFALGANDSVADQVRATNSGTLFLHANTAALNGQAVSGGTLHTVAISNLSTSALVNQQSSLLNMGADLVLSQDLDIRGTGVNVATVNANGFDIIVRDVFVGRFGNHGEIINRGTITATRHLESSGGSFSLNAGDSVANQVRATSGGSLSLHANTAAQTGIALSGGTLTTAATTNLSTSAQANGQGSLINLGANLALSGDLEIFGTGANAAIVSANGFDISANRFYVGRFDNSGELLNDGAITVNQLLFDRSSLDLTGGDDIVQDVLSILDNSKLNVIQSIGDLNGLTLNGNSLTIDATSQMVLDFDGQVGVGVDWGFRWINPFGDNRVASLTALLNDGRIAVNAPVATSIFDGGDGYTYIGYSTIPEPSSLCLLTLVAALGFRRRARG
ncbi:MAG: hypothetical protein KF851_17860 [Pirellulaceae bacterium]|nr:hypothetical protein [Pirellulaceae bacterium]